MTWIQNWILEKKNAPICMCVYKCVYNSNPKTATIKTSDHRKRQYESNDPLHSDISKDCEQVDNLLKAYMIDAEGD